MTDKLKLTFWQQVKEFFFAFDDNTNPVALHMRAEINELKEKVLILEAQKKEWEKQEIEREATFRHKEIYLFGCLSEREKLIKTLQTNIQENNQKWHEIVDTIRRLMKRNTETAEVFLSEPPADVVTDKKPFESESEE